MEITVTSWPPFLLTLPVSYIIIILGLAFMLIGFWVRSPFVYLAVLCCMLTILFSDTFADYPWVLMALGFISLWAILAAIKTIMVRGGEG